MKSFALHLVVVFILGAQYQQMISFCSSTPTSSSATSASHGRFNGSDSSSSGAATLHQAIKTPRTIQRLIGGHIQHGPDKNHSGDTSNATNQLSRLHFRRKQNAARNTYRSRKNSTVLKKIEPVVRDKYDDYFKDSALLEENNDVDSWDGGILRLSAGAGREDTPKNKKKDESKKTLADQVKDGKYGLIENELFRNVPKRPGIISYLSNKEVPNDNAKNYGGLKEEEIWLAEDHLLVIKGGSLNSDDNNEPWTPIDDYHAPNRQIKIPPNPKVPPPFPVQFEDNEPIQFIGDHKFPFFYPNANESVPLFPENGYGPTEANSDDEKNLLAGPRSSQNATNGKDRYLYPQPFPPWLFNNESFANPFLNFGPPPQNPYPFDNGSDYVDEDDPSLYYPPPYSFVYKSNYSSPVEPGPLVPGIVLPPPPNAFGRLEGKPQRNPNKAIPFREVLTKITEKRPQFIATTTTTTELSTTTTTTTSETPPTKEIYYIRPRPRPYQAPPTTTTSTTTQVPPELITFVPQVSTNTDSLSNGRPIYYEYFDATREPPPNQVSYTTPPTLAPPKQYKPQPIYSSPIFKQIAPQPNRQHQPQVQQEPLRINKVFLPSKPYNYDNYLYITPKPEIRPNGISTNFISLPVRQSYKHQPTFDREVDAIRQTLQYYKSKQLQQSHIQRSPKTKAVYEYSFDATAPNSNNNNYPSQSFTPPVRYDAEPFKPMVQYSRPVDDVNGFKAIAYPRNDRLPDQKNNYYTSTARPEAQTLEVQIGDSNYNRQSAQGPTPQPINYIARDQRNFDEQQQIQYTSPRTTILTNQPWISIEKQVVQEILPQADRSRPSNQKDINRSIPSFSRNIVAQPRQHQQPTLRPQIHGYYYSEPAQQRPNHRYQQFGTEHPPFNQHISSIRSQLNQYQHRPVSLVNDTYINNIPGRIINPDAEYINLAPRRELFQQQRLPPPQPNRGGGGGGGVVQQYHQPINYDRDILVNYKLPLPPINPDSEFIQPQIINRNPQPQPIYHRPAPLQQYTNRGPSNDRPSNVYYVTPQRDVRYKKA